MTVHCKGCHRRQGIEFNELSLDGYCEICEEHRYRMQLRERARRGKRVPAISKPECYGDPTGWTDGQVEFICKVLRGGW